MTAPAVQSTLADRLSLLRGLKDARAPLVAVLAGTLTVQYVSPAAVAVATGVLVGRFTEPGPPDGLFRAALLPILVLGVVLLTGHLLETLAGPLSFVAKSRIDGRHRARLAHHVSGLALATLEQPQVQDLIRVCSADPTNWTEKTPGDGAVGQLRLVTRYAGAVAGCAVLARYSWWAVAVVVVPGFAVRVLRRGHWLSISRLWAAGAAEERRIGYWRGIATAPAESKELRIFGFGDWATARLRQHVTTMFAPVWHRGLAVIRLQWLDFGLQAVPLAVVYAAAVAGAAGGTDPLPVAVAVLAAGWSTTVAITGTGEVFDVEGAVPGARARRLVFRLPAEAAATTGSNGSNRPGHAAAAPAPIRFDQVCFGYPGSGRTVLDRLDLEIRPGETLAIVGLNGAGKSTVVKLLAGLYLPTSGSISCAGTDLRDIGLDRWRGRVAVVFQDFVKYHLPAAENVWLGNARVPADRAALRAAAARAGVDPVIGRLPAGWDTPLARTRRGGVDLSGGQWQQLALARALYAVHTGASVLVLDEPTAHLDVRTEHELFDRLIDRGGATSTVLVSHRLSTVRRADRIVVLAGGRITESGSHPQLMALDGAYARMFRLQAARFARADDQAGTVGCG